MRYAAHLTQDGGCDYTIACGEALIFLEAATLEEARAEAIDTCGNETHLDPDGDRRLAGITILEIAGEHEMDVDAMWADIKAKREASKEWKREQRERAEYERLREKYGAGGGR